MNRSRIGLFVGLPMLLIGLLLSGLALYKSFTTYQFLEDAIEAEGQVIGLVNKGGESGSAVRYVFPDRTGRLHTHTTNWSSNPPAYDIGEAIPVRYLDGDPDGHEVGGRVAIWWAEAVLGAIGLGLLFVGILLLVLFSRGGSPTVDDGFDINGN